MSERLTNIERAVLQEFFDHPTGWAYNTKPEMDAMRALADANLLCSPHPWGSGIFSRITDEGCAALREQKDASHG